MHRHVMQTIPTTEMILSSVKRVGTATSVLLTLAHEFPLSVCQLSPGRGDQARYQDQRDHEVCSRHGFLDIKT